MSKKTITLSFVLTDAKGNVECDSTTVWNDLDEARVLFVEEKIIGSLVALNKDAQVIINSK
jgi:hypothetical protein